MKVMVFHGRPRKGNTYKATPIFMDEPRNVQYIESILDAIIDSEVFIFTMPHYGVCSMSSGMKNLLDYLDFLTLMVAPRRELFTKSIYYYYGHGFKSGYKANKKLFEKWGE